MALLPSGAYQLVKRGHEVVVERGAGVGAGFPDAEYKQAGATLTDSHATVFAKAGLIVKVKEPLPSEFGLLRPGQMLFTYLHLAAGKPLTEALMKSRVTALAYETIEVNRRLPLLEPMSEIAGRMSILVGGYFLAKHFGGSGVLLGGVPGVLPGKVVVLGGCAETSRPTTHHDPVFVEEGVTHYCMANMPGAFARTATQALTNVTYRYIESLADHGLAEACRLHLALLGSINVMNGKLTHQAVAEAHGMKWEKPCRADLSICSEDV